MVDTPARFRTTILWTVSIFALVLGGLFSTQVEIVEEQIELQRWVIEEEGNSRLLYVLMLMEDKIGIFEFEEFYDDSLNDSFQAFRKIVEYRQEIAFLRTFQIVLLGLGASIIGGMVLHYAGEWTKKLEEAEKESHDKEEKGQEGLRREG